MCIVIFTICSALLMGCLYTQPSPTRIQDSNEQATQPDSTRSEALLALLQVADSASVHLPAVHFPDSVRSHSFDSTSTQLIEADSTSLSRRDLLELQFKKWAGTPHVWGGNDHSGIDCSALVQQVYRDVFDTPIPRTTKEQVRVGNKIRVAKLEVGDLVFYRINPRTRHVGIYMGDNAFFHVSKSDGVAITSLDDPYWRARFWMARRIIPSELDEGDINQEVKKVEITW